MYFKEKRLASLFDAARLVIFDLNGLIIDDEKFKLQAFNQALKTFRIKISQKFWINRCVGATEFNNFQKILEFNKIATDTTQINDLIHKQHIIYQKLIKSQVRALVRQGALEMISFIKTKTNKKLALATSTNKLGYRLILGKRGLDILNKFNFVICGDDIVKSKPDPEIYLRTAQHFAIKSDSCLVFEDAAAGVAAAKNAGMICVAVPSEYTKNQNFCRADLIVSDMTIRAHILR